MTVRVALVSCGSSKQASAAPASDLYISWRFRSLRAYAAANADAWYILSARHGLLLPDQVVEPYDQTLDTMSKSDRQVWADRVQRQLLQVLPPGATVIVLAGKRYRVDLIPYLCQRGFTVRVPFEGLTLFQQAHRLKQLAANGYVER
jgi:hypothetical protein